MRTIPRRSMYVVAFHCLELQNNHTSVHFTFNLLIFFFSKTHTFPNLYKTVQELFKQIPHLPTTPNSKITEPRHEKTCLCHMQTTKAQMSLRIRLTSTFVVRCLDSIISLVSISDISSLYLASVAARAGLSFTWSKPPKTGFLVTRLN